MNIILGNSLEKLKGLEDNSIDSIVTDPPYELGFMGKSWDNTGIANNPDLWAECLRVLKPGGHLLAFSGTRTYHRMAVAIEDAGFEVRDMIEWVYGSGFPKSLNISKAIEKMNGVEPLEKIPNKGERFYGQEGSDYHLTPNRLVMPETQTKDGKKWEGWGTALKPAHEPICMARKPLAEKTVAENVLKYGTGGINIDESRVGFNNYDKTDYIEKRVGYKDGFNHNQLNGKDETAGYKLDKNEGTETPVFNSQGRFPANLIHDNSDEVKECFPETHGAGNKSASSATTSSVYNLKKESNMIYRNIHNDNGGNASRFFKSIPQGRFPANLIHDNSDEVKECFPETSCSGAAKTGRKNLSGKNYSNPDNIFGGGLGQQTGTLHNDSGNASRFFKSIIYNPKASKSERNKGCEGLEEKEVFWHNHKGRDMTNPKNYIGGKVLNQKSRNTHPTVKPIALMEYLIKMVTPKGGIVLDPFMGSGSTGVAAKKNGYDFIGIDMTPEYVEIAKARINATEIENRLI